MTFEAHIIWATIENLSQSNDQIEVNQVTKLTTIPKEKTEFIIEQMIHFKLLRRKQGQVSINEGV